MQHHSRGPMNAGQRRWRPLPPTGCQRNKRQHNRGNPGRSDGETQKPTPTLIATSGLPTPTLRTINRQDATLRHEMRTA